MIRGTNKPGVLPGQENPVPFPPARSQGNGGCLRCQGCPRGRGLPEPGGGRGSMDLALLLEAAQAAPPCTELALGCDAIMYPAPGIAAPVAPDQPGPGTALR